MTALCLHAHQDGANGSLTEADTFLKVQVKSIYSDHVTEFGRPVAIKSACKMIGCRLLSDQRRRDFKYKGKGLASDLVYLLNKSAVKSSMGSDVFLENKDLVQMVLL